MRRTNETARIILAKNSQAADIKLQDLSGLRDINYGFYEGRMDSDVLAEVTDYFNKANYSTEDLLSYISQTDSSGFVEIFVNFQPVLIRLFTN